MSASTRMIGGAPAGAGAAQPPRAEAPAAPSGRPGGLPARLRARAHAILHGPTQVVFWPATSLRRVALNVPFVCLLLYLFIVHSGRLPIAQLVLALGLATTPLLPGGLRFPAPMAWFTGLLGWALVSSLASPFREQSLTMTYELAKVWLIALLGINAIRSREQLRLVVVVWLGLFAVFPVRGTLANYAAGIGTFGRYYWNFSFENPNDLASFCLLQVGLCFALLQVERVKWLRITAMLGIGALSFVIAITQSRGGMLALGTLFGIAFLRQRQKARMLLLMVGAGAVVLIAAPEKVLDRLGGLAALTGGVENIEEVDPEQSAASRWAIWRVAGHVFSERPVTGVGWGTYAVAHATYHTEVPGVPITARGRRDAHSTFVRLAAEMGAPGLLLFLGIIISSRRMAKQARARMRSVAPEMEGFLLALAAGQLGYLQAGLFGSYAHLPFLYLYSGLMVVTVILFANFAAATATPPGALGRPRFGRPPAPRGLDMTGAASAAPLGAQLAAPPHRS